MDAIILGPLLVTSYCTMSLKQPRFLSYFLVTRGKCHLDSLTPSDLNNLHLSCIFAGTRASLKDKQKLPISRRAEKISVSFVSKTQKEHFRLSHRTYPALIPWHFLRNWSTCYLTFFPPEMSLGESPEHAVMYSFFFHKISLAVQYIQTVIQVRTIICMQFCFIRNCTCYS